MKTFLIATGMALGLGAFALAPAEAAPISTRAAIAAPTATSDVACRVVKKTVYRNGVRRVTTSKTCDRGGYGYGPRPAYGYGPRPAYGYGPRPRYGYGPRPRPGYYRHDPRPGLSIRVN
ncbi:hypothetical protein [Hansschlegelia plantiphila]|nr:hypothetical protein [Hansschlegelia plantiphila]